MNFIGHKGPLMSSNSELRALHCTDQGIITRRILFSKLVKRFNEAEMLASVLLK